MEDIFDWERILFSDLPGEFLLEVVFRVAVMFVFLLITLRIAGKRGVRQLSIFEIVIIIALGSAAGDPMFYEDVGILPALVVFTVVILLYRFATWLTGVSDWFGKMLEGEVKCLIDEGRFSMSEFEKEVLAQEEFYSELRLKSIEHLGQVKYAFMEPSGEVSVFFYPPEEIRPGLPLIPHLYNRKSREILSVGLYACALCGQVEELAPGERHCPRCGREEWVSAIDTQRIA